MYICIVSTIAGGLPRSCTVFRGLAEQKADLFQAVGEDIFARHGEGVGAAKLKETTPMPPLIVLLSQFTTANGTLGLSNI